MSRTTRSTYRTRAGRGGYSRAVDNRIKRELLAEQYGVRPSPRGGVPPYGAALDHAAQHGMVI